MGNTSQAVARIADRTVSQQTKLNSISSCFLHVGLLASPDVIGHVIIRFHMQFPIDGPLEPSLYL